MADNKEKETQTPQEEFISLNFSKSELQAIAKEAGYDDDVKLEEIASDPSFLKSIQNTITNRGRRSGYAEAFKVIEGFGKEFGIVPKTNEKGKPDMSHLTSEIDAYIKEQIKNAKKSGESSKDIKELEATLERQKEEQIAAVKAERAAELEALKAESDKIKNDYELLKGKQYDNELMDVINSNIPVTDDAQKLPYEMKPAFKKIVLNEIKKNIEVKQDDNGKNTFTKKGTEIPFSFKDGSETVILKSDGSNIARYIRHIMKEEDILIIKNVQPQQQEKAPLAEQKKAMTTEELRKAQAEETRAALAARHKV